MMQLTRAQADEAIAGANKRQDYAEQVHLPNYDGRTLTPEYERENHHVGAIAEWASAALLGQKFDPSVGDLDATDLKIIEVRGRRIGPNSDLPMRRNDENKLRLPFFLVRINLNRLTAEFVGWLCGWEAWERRTTENCHFGVWYIPPPYHTVLSLQQWVLCGHRLHWAPERYRCG